MKMYLIADNVDTEAGMRLAGVEGVVEPGNRRVAGNRKNCRPDSGRDQRDQDEPPGSFDCYDSGSARQQPGQGFDHTIYQRSNWFENLRENKC